jgi:hypothetical protein
LPDPHELVFLQPVDGFSDDDARDAEALGQLALGGQGGTG